MEAWSNTLIHANPFEKHLLPWPDCSLPAVAFEAPLPLACWRNAAVSADCGDRAFHRNLNQVQVLAHAGTATTMDLPGRDWVSLLFVAAGELQLQQGHKVSLAVAGDWLLVPPPPVQWQSTSFNVLCLMAPLQQLEGVQPLLLQRMHASHGAVQASLLDMLSVSLRGFAALTDGHATVLGTLALDQHLLRLIAVLAVADGSQESGGDSPLRPHGSARDAVDDLISYIKANLDQPLNLTVLQNRSHYSRRALQYAFRERLGCTVTQWIRAQRLDLARRLLLAAAPGDSVSSIAQACGYHAMGLFSIDFQQRFHVKPSALLREARAAAEAGTGPDQPTGST
jgi:AraC-like DNA-binding protein